MLFPHYDQPIADHDRPTDGSQGNFLGDESEEGDKKLKASLEPLKLGKVTDIGGGK